MTAEPRRLHPPDLQRLVDRFGTYPAITEDAWTEFRRLKDVWQSLHQRPHGAVLDTLDAKQYAQDVAQEPRQEDPARHALFAVVANAEGQIGTEEILAAISLVR